MWCSLHPENESHDIIGEIIAVTEGFELLQETLLELPKKLEIHVPTYVLTMEAQPERSSGQQRVMVCQILRDRTELLILQNWVQNGTLGLRCRVRKKNCQSSTAARTARKKSMTVLNPSGVSDTPS